MKEFIKGKITKKIYTTDNGYLIANFKIKETNINDILDLIGKSITITGYFSQINENELYMLYGNITEHPKYGLQFQTDKYERLKPEDKDGIVEFLSSDLFPGIGESIAKKIVDKLGENTLEIIIQNPNSLLTIKSLNSKKRQIIYDTLINYEDSHKTIVYLTELGFIMKDALSIYNKYKNNTIYQIENDIYQISEDIEEISFTKIDSIALSLNKKQDDENRIKACILYIVKNITFSNGDVYLLIDEIYENVFGYLRIKIDLDLFKQYIDELRYEDKIIIDEEKYYLKEMYEQESYVASTLKTINNKKIQKNEKLYIELEELEKTNNIQYNDKQKDAIIKALENNISIITGGPGTGKTTIVKAIVKLYKKINKYTDEQMIAHTALLAPTGRASKRLSDSTGLPAMTIHRFLKWNKESNTFNVNEYNKDYSDLIIVDEVSMLDLNIFYSLLKGLTKKIQIILVGDFNQLPSVGPGQVLKDLIESNKIETIYLDYLYRQKQNSYINTLAYDIKNEKLDNITESHDDYLFLECSNEAITKNIENICNQIKEKNYDLKDFQVMAPMYYGLSGIDSLNEAMQKIFNPASNDKAEIKYGNTTFRENDKVLQLVNIPDENIYNGDIGTIIRIVDAKTSESKKTEIYINYYGNIIKYLPKDLAQIKHGYVISVHKSQGSEFDTVIIITSNQHKRMLYKKLIYTAVTRAKRKLIIIGQQEAFKYAILNNAEHNRKTTLLEKIINN